MGVQQQTAWGKDTTHKSIKRKEEAWNQAQEIVLMEKKIRKISSQGSVWQKRKQAPQGTGLAKDWTETLPRFTQNRRSKIIPKVRISSIYWWQSKY